MGNFKKKIDQKLKKRQEDYDNNLRGDPRFRRPGSRNPHKQGAGHTVGSRKSR